MVERARSFVGVPFLHQGRDPEIGLDCLGLVLAMMHGCRYRLDFHYDTYPAQPHKHTLYRHLKAETVEIDAADILPADLLLLRYDRHPQHVAVVSSFEPYFKQGIIHSYNDTSIQKVVEHTLDHMWRQRIVTAFRFPVFTDQPTF